MLEEFYIRRTDLNWSKEPVIGSALLLKGATIDSLGDPIKATVLYDVGQHKKNGMVAILARGKEARLKQFNMLLAAENRLN